MRIPIVFQVPDWALQPDRELAGGSSSSAVASGPQPKDCDLAGDVTSAGRRSVAEVEGIGDSADS